MLVKQVLGIYVCFSSKRREELVSSKSVTWDYFVKYIFAAVSFERKDTNMLLNLNAIHVILYRWAIWHLNACLTFLYLVAIVFMVTHVTNYQICPSDIYQHDAVFVKCQPSNISGCGNIVSKWAEFKYNLKEESHWLQCFRSKMTNRSYCYGGNDVKKTLVTIYQYKIAWIMYKKAVEYN